MSILPKTYSLMLVPWIPDAVVTITPLPASSNPVAFSESTPAPGYCSQRRFGANALTLSGNLYAQRTSASCRRERNSSVRVIHSIFLLAASLKITCDAGENETVVTTIGLSVTINYSLHGNRGCYCLYFSLLSLSQSHSLWQDRRTAPVCCKVFRIYAIILSV